jgi:FAD:protein FMN transferase
MRQVEFIMGMPITVDIPSCDDTQVFDSVFKRLRAIDERFSPYKNDSELCRFQKKEIQEKKLSAEFKKIMSACEDAKKQTGGFFSAYFSGKYDPSGYVKGWAISEAGKVIEKNGFKTYCIGAGGDILARSDSGKIWNIGIQDPTDKTKLADTISGKNIAVATSGNYERGKHIMDPKTGRPADTFLSVSIIGPDIIMADILATACFAAGNIELLDKMFKNYKALTI